MKWVLWWSGQCISNRGRVSINIRNVRSCCHEVANRYWGSYPCISLLRRCCGSHSGQHIIAHKPQGWGFLHAFPFEPKTLASKYLRQLLRLGHLSLPYKQSFLVSLYNYPCHRACVCVQPPPYPWNQQLMDGGEDHHYDFSCEHDYEHILKIKFDQGIQIRGLRST